MRTATKLFIATAALLAAAPVCSAAPRAMPVLYDQSHAKSGQNFMSANFIDSDDLDTYSADDFVVPEGVKWQIRHVFVYGWLSRSGGFPPSQNVVFYRDARGRPGREIAAYDGIQGEGSNNGDYLFRLDKAVTLRPGHYWLMVQSNELAFQPPVWGWSTSTKTYGRPAAFKNPSDAYLSGCVDWSVRFDCFPDYGHDFLFKLMGHVLSDQ